MARTKFWPEMTEFIVVGLGESEGKAKIGEIKSQNAKTLESRLLDDTDDQELTPKKRTRRRAGSLHKAESTSQKKTVPGIQIDVAGSPKSKLQLHILEEIPVLTLNEVLNDSGKETFYPIISPNKSLPKIDDKRQLPRRRYGDNRRDFDRELAFASADEW